MKLEVVIEAIDKASQALGTARAGLESVKASAQKMASQVKTGMSEAARPVAEVSNKFIELDVKGRQLRSAMLMLGNALGGTAEKTIGLAANFADALLSVNPLIMGIKLFGAALQATNAIIDAFVPSAAAAADGIKKIQKSIKELETHTNAYLESQRYNNEALGQAARAYLKASDSMDSMRAQLDDLKKQVNDAADSWMSYIPFVGDVHRMKVSGLVEQYNKLSEALQDAAVNQELLKQAAADESMIKANQAMVDAWMAGLKKQADNIKSEMSKVAQQQEATARRIAEANRRAYEQDRLGFEAMRALKEAAAREEEEWQRRVQAVIKRTSEEWRKQEEYIRRYEDAVAAAADESMAKLQELYDTTLRSAKAGAEYIGGLWQQFKAGVGDAVASAIVSGTSFSAAMTNVLKTLIASAISGLIQLALQTVVVGAIFKTTNTTQAVARMATLSAETFAAAFAATAAIPIVGPVLAPGVAAGAQAAMLAGATAAGAAGATLGGTLGALHGGIEYVPQEGTYLLQRGERVLSPAQNEELVQYLRSGRAGVSVGKIDLMPGARVDEALLNKPKRYWRRVVEERLLDALDEVGRNGAVLTIRTTRSYRR